MKVCAINECKTILRCDNTSGHCQRHWRKSILRKPKKNAILNGCKPCSNKTCEQVNPQPIDNFGKDTARKDKLNPYCKICRNKVGRVYRESCDKTELSLYQKQYRKLNPEKVKQRSHNYFIKNKDRLKIKHASWRHNNKEKCYQYTKKYLTKNPHKMCAYAAKRRATKLQQTPKWLTKDHFILIDMYYQQRDYLIEVTGMEWEVDHIIPLKGRNVRGLHVPWNLRVIPAKENHEKNNKI